MVYRQEILGLFPLIEVEGSAIKLIQPIKKKKYDLYLAASNINCGTFSRMWQLQPWVIWLASTSLTSSLMLKVEESLLCE